MKLSIYRKIVQASSAFLANSYLGCFFTKNVNTNSLKGVCVPFLNCYACPSAVFSCPIGALQHFMAIRTLPIYLMSFIAVVGLTFGRMACGWICPFGFLQDLMFKIKSPKYKIAYYLNYLKYFVLLFLVILIPYYTGEAFFSQLCPAGKLFAGIPWKLWNPVNDATGLPMLVKEPGFIFYLGLVILFAFLIWFVLSKRPFCRVACPMGAILALFNKYSLIQLEVNKNCDGCNICQINCPMDLNVSIDYDSGDCIRCLECTRCGHIKVTSLVNIKEGVNFNAKTDEKPLK